MKGGLGNMSVEASLKEMSENISQIIGIVEDVKEIKIKTE